MRALAAFLLCWIQASAAGWVWQDPITQWLDANGATNAEVFCAGRVGGMLDIDRAFIVRKDGATVTATFPNQGEPFTYSMRLEFGELQHLAVLVGYSQLLTRERGIPSANDGGNWEVIVQQGGRANHTMWNLSPSTFNPRMDFLEIFLSRVSYQAEVARRLSAGLSDTLIDRCLQPHRFKSSVSPRDETADLKAFLQTGATWQQAKAWLESLTESTTAEAWCGYVAGYLIETDHRQRDAAVCDLWRHDKVHWAGIPARHRSRLWPVLAMASSGELQDCRLTSRLLAEPVAPPEPPPRTSVSDTRDDRTLDSLPAPVVGGGR